MIREIEATITERTTVSGQYRYGFKQVMPDTSTGEAIDPVSAITGTTTTNFALERNNVAVEIGARVTLRHYGYVGGQMVWVFSATEGTGGDGAGSGSAWTAGLRQAHCLWVSFVSAEGACGCFEPFERFPILSEDGLTWTDVVTIPGCGVNYAVTFSKEGCDGPCATITSVDGHPCCGETFEADVDYTVVIGGVTYTATLTRGMGETDWTGTLLEESPEPGDTCEAAPSLTLDQEYSFETATADEFWLKIGPLPVGDYQINYTTTSNLFYDLEWYQGDPDCSNLLSGGTEALATSGCVTTAIGGGTATMWIRVESSVATTESFTLEISSGVCP